MTIIAKPLLLCLKTLRISTINEKWLPLARKVEKKGIKTQGFGYAMSMLFVMY
jgi:hypothetical protein